MVRNTKWGVYVESQGTVQTAGEERVARPGHRMEAWAP